MDPDRRQRLNERFESITELPLLALSVLIVPLLVAPLLFDLGSDVENAFFALDWTIWAVFAAELAFKTYRASDRRRYLVKHWPDVLIVVIPFLRPLRIVRSARALRLLRGGRALVFVYRALTSARRVLAGHGLQYALLVATIVVFASAGLVTLLENQGDGPITDFDDGLWWAITTITTVGYGDEFPVTSAGRGLGVVLMLVGIAVFGILTASLAAFFVEGDEADRSLPTIADLMDKLETIEEQVAELRRGQGEHG